jgi:hypothetical protein
MQDEGKEERHAGNWILRPKLGLRELIYKEKGDANCNVVSPNNNNNNNNNNKKGTCMLIRCCNFRRQKCV